MFKHIHRPTENKALVRSFSDEWKTIEPKNSLAQGLSVKVEQDRQKEDDNARSRVDWKLLFTDAAQLADNVPEEDQILAEQSCALAKAWETFVSKLPKEQQENVRMQPPSLLSVRNAVQSANRIWQDKRENTKRGRLKQMIAKVSRSCDDHSDLLAIIPQDDKYVSLVAGSLKSIVKACINHEKIAEGVASSMDELCEEIAYWKRLMQKHGNNWFMQKYIRDLYVVVFEFFTQVFTQWSVSGWRRLINSFDKNAFDELFTVQQNKMKLISEKLEREARLERDNKLDDMFRTMTAKNESSSGTIDPQLIAVLVALGSSGQKFLEEADMKANVKGAPLLGAPGKIIDVPEAESSILEEPEKCSVRYSRRELLNSHAGISSLLLKHDEDVQHLIPRAIRAQVDVRVAQRLKAMLHSPGPSCLWVQGPSHVSMPSQNTLTAVYVAAAAENSKLQIISHFCSLELRKAWTAQEHLILLLKSMIAQAIRFVPEKFDTDRDLSPTRLEACFSSGVMASYLLAVLDDLLSAIPGDVMCVVDGVQALEQRGDRAHTKDLLQTLRSLFTRGREHQRIKFCVTTDGYADSLAVLSNEDMVETMVFDHEPDDTCDVRSVKLGAER